jgi:Api92-like protein with ferredoxin domain
MPNHCTNVLSLSGSQTEIDECFDSVKGDDRAFDFNKVLPYPEEYAALDRAAEQWKKDNPGEWKGRPKDGFNSGGYEWCCENWSTKWNAYEECRDPKDGTKIIFRTAWNPPTKVLIELSKRFPSLHFKLDFSIEMMGDGTQEFQNGEVLKSEYSEDDYKPEGWDSAVAAEQKRLRETPEGRARVEAARKEYEQHGTVDTPDNFSPEAEALMEEVSTPATDGESPASTQQAVTE